MPGAIRQMNDFHNDLKFSHSCSDSPLWLRAYSEAFPSIASITDLREDGEHQRKGIDRVIVLNNGKVLYIDEKVRRGKWKDIALEYVSNDVKQSPGWVCKDLFCDYIAYALPQQFVCYMLPTIQLQLAWKKNSKNWINLYGKKVAKNNRYNTLFCPVPVADLFREIGKCLRVAFK